MDETNPQEELQETVAGDAAAQPDPRIGTTLSGRYLIEERLGEGAMGVVYKGEHTLMRMPVAIKVLQKSLSSDAEVMQRFQREAQSAGRIGHPNVCAATDFGQTDDGELFMVMEYLQGRTLTDEIAIHGALSPVRVVGLGLQLCAALEAAHAIGVIHRDLKPENVMLVGAGATEQIKVMDFGVASVSQEGPEDVKLTRAGAVYGTPAYMAPEQVTGDGVDARSDLYALGVLLHECLTGDLPFEAKTATQMMTLHLTTEPAPLPSSIPARLRALVDALLAKDPGDRPADATETARLLEVALEDDPAPPERASLPPLLPASTDAVAATRRTNTVLVIAALGVVGLVVFLGMVVVALTLSPDDSSEGEAAVAKEISASLGEERDAFVREANLSGALEALARDDHDAALAALAEAAKAHPDSSHLRYYEGIAQMAKGDEDAALERYAAAITADARYADDTQLLGEVVGLLGERSKKRREAADAFITEHLSGSKGLDAALTEAALEGGSRRGRSAAFDLLESRGALTRMDPATKLRLELRTASGCKNKEKLVEAAEELGDPAVLPELKELAATKKTGCGLLNLEDCLKCTRSELDRAIDTLEAKQAGE